MIDTAPKTKRSTNRLTNRSTTGEGHVVRHGDVRRVRKVHVDSPTSRTLRGQPPAQTSSRYMRRTETVRNRLTQKQTTKPLPLSVAKAQTQEPRNQKDKKTRTTTARAYKRVYNPSSNSKHIYRLYRKPAAGRFPARTFPLSRWAGEGRGEGEGRCGARRTPPTNNATQKPTPQTTNNKIPRIPQNPQKSQFRQTTNPKFRTTSGILPVITCCAD